MAMCSRTSLLVIVFLAAIQCALLSRPFGKFGRSNESRRLLLSDPDIDRNVSELITSKGYPVENHWVTSEDGYTVGIQRIPYGRKGNSGNTTRKTVFLMHGILETSADWVLNAAHSSLGFILADNGYDVWLGNYRGNTYGQKHAYLSVHDKRFWEFTYDQIAEFDIPAFFNHIKDVTGQEKILYCGFSLAASILLAFLSNKPEHNDMVESAVLIAPAVFNRYFNAPSGAVVPKITDSATALGIDSIGLFQDQHLNQDISIKICGNPLTRYQCSFALEFLSGKLSGQLNQTRLVVYLAHSPSGTSLRQVKQAVQMGRQDVFSKFDFGYWRNFQQYGQYTPPIYNLSTVKVPIAIISALTDQMVAPGDVDHLLSQLNTVYASHIIKRMWNHLDNVWGKDAHIHVYPRVLQFFGN